MSAAAGALGEGGWRLGRHDRVPQDERDALTTAAWQVELRLIDWPRLSRDGEGEGAIVAGLTPDGDAPSTSASITLPCAAPGAPTIVTSPASLGMVMAMVSGSSPVTSRVHWVCIPGDELDAYAGVEFDQPLTAAAIGAHGHGPPAR